MFNIPFLEHIQKVAQQKNTQVFLVGGALRDEFLNRSVCDYDFAVSHGGYNIAQEFAETVHGAFVPLDESRGCARVVKKIDHKMISFDFADFRGSSIQDDLVLRDFTINTFALNVSVNEWSSGSHLENVFAVDGAKKDLENRVIRMVSPKAFSDDPLRMVRAFSLTANLQGTIEDHTFNQVCLDHMLLKNVSYERITTELFKILAAHNSYKFIRLMDEVSLLEQMIPQLKIMFDCKQGGYHHLDVWPHSIETVRQLEMLFDEVQDNFEIDSYLREEIGGRHSRRTLMKLGALLHDIGKPDTRKKEGERLSFHGHERVGRDITHHVAKLLRLSSHQRHVLEDMVMYHLRPGYLSNFEKPSERMVYRYFRDTKDEAVNVLLLSLADQRSTRGPLTSENDQLYHERICLQLINEYFRKKKEKPIIKLIKGDDLINELNLIPSPLFTTILKTVEEQQVLGHVNSREEALDLAREIANHKMMEPQDEL